MAIVGDSVRSARAERPTPSRPGENGVPVPPRAAFKFKNINLMPNGVDRLHSQSRAQFTTRSGDHETPAPQAVNGPSPKG